MKDTIKGNAGSLNAPQEKNELIFSVLAQYLKDASFENPQAPEVLVGGGVHPKIDVGFDVNVKKRSEDQFQVELEIKVRSEHEARVLFLLEIIYAGLFKLENIPDDQLEIACLVECPKILFPFARQIISDMTHAGGFPPLLIDPINFGLLYKNHKQGKL